MRYILISKDGSLIHGNASTYTEALDQVGPEGWNRVQLTRDLAGWVNDTSLVNPKYGRNPVAGLLLMALGAAEVVGLSPTQVLLITAVYDAFVSAVYDDLAAVMDDEMINYPTELAAHTPELDAELAALLNLVSTGPVPGWDVYTL